MTFLLTNDDGIDAPGIRTLHSAVSKVVQEQIVLAAPKNNLTGCGHQVNIRTGIHVDKRSFCEFAVESTPADCVRLGLHYLCNDVKFVLSGINAGCNLGVADFYSSGTIAAAREAALHGIPAIAFSQFERVDLELNWKQAEQWTISALNMLLNRPIEKGEFWIVNFPHLSSATSDPEVSFCELSAEPLSAKFSVNGEYFQYIGDRDNIDRVSVSGTDVDACLSGKISVTKVRSYQ